MATIAPVQAARVAFLRPQDIAGRHADAWDDLAAHAGEPNPFLERWFVDASIAHLPIPVSLRVAFVWTGDGHLGGVVPLAVDDQYGRLPLRHIRVWGHYHSFLGTPLIRAGFETRFWEELLMALDTADWTDGLLLIPDMTAGGPAEAGLRAAAAGLGRPCDAVHHFGRALLQSPLSASAYYENTVRKKKRKEIKRLQARLAECGAVTVHALEGSADAASWCADFLALEASGWKGDAGSALASDAATRAFFVRAINQGYEAGRVDMLKLALDGRPLAMLVNFIALPGSFSFKIAYDEAFARFSPGVLISLENLKILERPGFGWMDSCAAEGHPMIESLWGQRRALNWMAVPLGGGRNAALFRLARFAENSWSALKALRGKAGPANDNRERADD
jgi:CelD/BcsL family acetyltransferase involved in cellulose biosynthesis